MEEQGYDLTFINAHNKSDSAMSYIEHCRYRGFDGIFAACVNFYDPRVIELVQSEIPIVTVRMSRCSLSIMRIVSKMLF